MQVFLLQNEERKPVTMRAALGGNGCDSKPSANVEEVGPLYEAENQVAKDLLACT